MEYTIDVKKLVTVDDWVELIDREYSNESPTDVISLLVNIFNVEDKKGIITKAAWVSYGHRLGICSFKDVCYKLKIYEDEFIPYKNPKNKLECSVNAYVKISKIIEFLNGDWVVDWSDPHQNKFTPHFEPTPSGFIYYDSNCWDNSTNVSSFLCFKDKNHAIYFSHVFCDLWNEYSPIENIRS